MYTGNGQGPCRSTQDKSKPHEETPMLLPCHQPLGRCRACNLSHHLAALAPWLVTACCKQLAVLPLLPQLLHNCQHSHNAAADAATACCCGAPRQDWHAAIAGAWSCPLGPGPLPSGSLLLLAPVPLPAAALHPARLKPHEASTRELKSTEGGDMAVQPAAPAPACCYGSC